MTRRCARVYVQGYYSTRPTLKALARRTEALLRHADASLAFARSDPLLRTLSLSPSQTSNASLVPLEATTTGLRASAPGFFVEYAHLAACLCTAFTSEVPVRCFSDERTLPAIRASIPHRPATNGRGELVDWDGLMAEVYEARKVRALASSLIGPTSLVSPSFFRGPADGPFGSPRHHHGDLAQLGPG